MIEKLPDADYRTIGLRTIMRMIVKINEIIDVVNKLLAAHPKIERQ